MKEFKLEKSFTNCVPSFFSGADNPRKHERIRTLFKSHKSSQYIESLSNHSESCKRRRAGGENVDFRARGFTSNVGSHGETRNGAVGVVQSVIIEKHSCWICQEEMSSEAVLLQHYKNHMTYVCEDDF